MSIPEFHIEYQKLKETALAYFPDEEDAEARELFLSDARDELLWRFNFSPKQIVHNMVPVRNRLEDEVHDPTYTVTSVLGSVPSPPTTAAGVSSAFVPDAASADENSTKLTAAAEGFLSPKGATPWASTTEIAATVAPSSSVCDSSTDVTSSVSTTAAVTAEQTSDRRWCKSVAPCDLSSTDLHRESATQTASNSADIARQDSVASGGIICVDNHFVESVALQDSASGYQRDHTVLSSTSADIFFKLVAYASNCYLPPADCDFLQSSNYEDCGLYNTVTSFKYHHDLAAVSCFPSEDIRASHALILKWAIGPGPPVGIIGASYAPILELTSASGLILQCVYMIFNSISCFKLVI